MVPTKMKQARIKCRECNCWSLTCGIKKKNKNKKTTKNKIRGYKTIHTFTKKIEEKANDNNKKNNNKSNNNNISINNNNNNSNNIKTKSK